MDSNTGPKRAHVLGLVRLDSPGVGEETVEDSGPPVLRCQHDRLLQVVVLLLRVSCPAHDPGLHEGRPRVRQQALNAAFIHLNTTRGHERRCAGCILKSAVNTATWWPERDMQKW